MSKVTKIKKDTKTEYFTGKIKDKGNYLQTQINENGIVIQSEKYSEIGQNIEEAFSMTFDDAEILQINTFIITEEYIIIEVISRL